MSAVRPLPPRPSLEFEHKEAKALLRLLRAGDPVALARFRERHPAIDATAARPVRLADAQLVIAREYGFRSWPRLVQYFEAAERQRHGRPPQHPGGRDFLDQVVANMIASHRERRPSAARTLAAYVPRFYGLQPDDIFTTDLTGDEARLAVARRRGFSSWETLLERAAMPRELEGDRPWIVDPMAGVGKAIEARDLEELKRAVAAHPELLAPPAYEASIGRRLLSTFFHHERQQGAEAMRPILAWLEHQGLDPQLELNTELLGHMRMTTDKVRWLLDRGADPSWVPPNGIPVLEQALIRWWNGEAVDVLAERSTPRKALWIAAGLGDVEGVRRSLDAGGRPTAAARRLRPDFDAVDLGYGGSHPDPTDEELLSEAFLVAMLNGRCAVLEYMVSRGFPVDSTAVWGSPIFHVAVGNAMTPMVECLLRCGARLDIPGNLSRKGATALQIAREMVEMFPKDVERRRIAELCGLDPDAILAERDARPAPPPGADPKLQEALELAGDDAFRLGQSDIGEENLVFGLLRSGGIGLMYFTKMSRMDLDRFRTDVADRIHPGLDRVDRPKLPFDSDAQAAIHAAIALATERRRERVHAGHLLHALLRDERGAAGRLLERYGSSATELQERMKGAL